MAASKARSKKPKALFTLKAPLRATAYRGKFKAFAATKYLSVRALKAARKTISIECGTVEAGGRSIAIAADIRKGKVVALRPLACAGCQDAGGKPRKINQSALKKTMRAVGEALQERGIATPRMPMPMRISSRQGFSIPLGPIVITIGDLGGEGWDACITVYIPGFNICWCCIFSGCRCYDIP